LQEIKETLETYLGAINQEVANTLAASQGSAVEKKKKPHLRRMGIVDVVENPASQAPDTNSKETSPGGAPPRIEKSKSTKGQDREKTPATQIEEIFRSVEDGRTKLAFLYKEFSGWQREARALLAEYSGEKASKGLKTEVELLGTEYVRRLLEKTGDFDEKTIARTMPLILASLRTEKPHPSSQSEKKRSPARRKKT
jgi:hypothetical protein